MALLLHLPARRRGAVPDAGNGKAVWRAVRREALAVVVAVVVVVVVAARGHEKSLRISLDVFHYRPRLAL